MSNRANWSSMMLTAAAFVVVVAGVQAAQSILLPFLVAAFLAVILTPPLKGLERRGLPTVLALLLIVLGLLLVGGGVLALVGASASDFTANLPLFEEALKDQVSQTWRWLGEQGVPLPAEADASLLEPQAVFRWLGIALRQVGNVLSLSLIVLIAVSFMLIESSRLPTKMKAALGKDHPAVKHLNEILVDVRRYMVIKTFTSLLTGLFVTVLTYFLGIEYALLWGLLAFLLNYIPFIGSTLAGIPAVLLAWVTAGPGTAAWTIVGYLVINNVVSNVIEPLFMGQGLGLSTLVVFLSLVFWGWVLGPIGMLLATPITMVFKIVLAEYADTHWIAELMSSKAPPGERPKDDGGPPTQTHGADD